MKQVNKEQFLNWLDGVLDEIREKFEKKNNEYNKEINPEQELKQQSVFYALEKGAAKNRISVHKYIQYLKSKHETSVDIWDELNIMCLSNVAPSDDEIKEKFTDPIIYELLEYAYTLYSKNGTL